MKFKKIPHKPKNPKHFMKMMYSLSRRDPLIRDHNLYLRVDKELMNKALVECHYGFFWIEKSKKVLSDEFI